MPVSNAITAEFYMPCGHTVAATWEKTLTGRNIELREPATYEDQLEVGINAINAKMLSMAARHDCGLVTDENPFGLTRTS